MAKKVYVGRPKVTQSLGELAEGTIVKINENGNPVDFYVAKHNYQNDLNGNGRTLLVRKDNYNQEARTWCSSNMSAYASSEISSWLNSTYKGLLDSSIQTAIASTKFYFTTGYGCSDVAVLSRPIFLLSITEFGSSYTNANVEGEALPIASLIRSLTLVGASNNFQWTRSPHKTSQDNVCWLSTSGGAGCSKCGDNSYKYGFRPCFTLPSDTYVNSSNIITGEYSYSNTSVARKVTNMYIGVPITSQRLGDMAVGTIVKIKEKGIPVDYIIVQQGRPSTKYDTSCNGTWLLRKECVKSREFNATYAYYCISGLWVYLRDGYPSIYNSAVQSLIKEAKIPYCPKGSSMTSHVKTGANGLPVKAFLLSAVELGIYDGLYAGGTIEEGSKLSYFQNGISDSAKTLRSCSRTYFTRTYYSSEDTDQVWYISAAGLGGNINYNRANGIRPAIILDSNAAVCGGLVDGATYSSGQMSIARRIKKAYVGVGGVARPFWTTEVAYYGQVTDLSAARGCLSATSVGNYALFAGGFSSAVVDAYDKSLTRTTPTTLSAARGLPAATTVGDYALFASCGDGSSTSNNKVVDVYNSSLTRSTMSLSISTHHRAATTVGNYALIGGGHITNASRSNSVETINTSLTLGSATNLSTARKDMVAASIGSYALFAGGQSGNELKGNGVNYKIIETYNSSLTKGTATNMSVNRRVGCSALVGDYVLIAGGWESTDSNVVDAYNSSLTKVDVTALSFTCAEGAATEAGDYAIIGGGESTGAVNAYDTSLVRTVLASLSERSTASRYEKLAATTVGSYALFGGGGTSSSSGVANVDAYCF